MGRSFFLHMWAEPRPFFAQRFRTILFDNGCIGRSDSPLRPFSIAEMAEDAAAVLDAAGEKRPRADAQRPRHRARVFAATCRHRALAAAGERADFGPADSGCEGGSAGGRGSYLSDRSAGADKGAP